MGATTEQVTADGPAPIGEAEPGDCAARPRSLDSADANDTVCMIEAGPRSRPKDLPQFPNPAPRPEGALPPLHLRFFSEVPKGVDIALGRVPQRDAAAYVRAIGAAGNRSIICHVNCAGGDGDGALAIATALLEHKYRVACRIGGRCSSGAALIALAADHRAIVPSGYVLVHTARRLCTPQQWEAILRLPEGEREEINNQLADLDDACSAMLQTRLGVSDHTARCWLGEDRKWPASEALERGFLHEIVADETEGTA
ncbi:ATP-dependent protease ClpP protease subunit [Bradyrhizobium sp. GM24.11]